MQIIDCFHLFVYSGHLDCRTRTDDVSSFPREMKHVVKHFDEIHPKQHYWLYKYNTLFIHIGNL